MVLWVKKFVNCFPCPNPVKAIFQKKKEKESPMEGAHSSTGEL
jgi:hypothetical protein